MCCRRLVGLVLVGITALTAASGAVASGEVWTHRLPGPDWQPPREIVHDALRINGTMASTLFNDFGWLYRIEVDSVGQMVRTVQPLAQVREGSHLIGDGVAPLLVAQTNTIPPTGFLQRNNPDRSLRWRRVNEQGSFAATIELASGAVATTAEGMVMRLDDDGQTVWQRPLADSGGGGVQVHRLFETAGRLLVIGNATLDGDYRGFVWVLDSADGKPLVIHYDVALRNQAVRELADGGVDLLNAAGSEVRLSHLSALGKPLQSVQLEGFAGGLRGVTAHATGFVLMGNTSESSAEIRYYDGAALRWRATSPVVSSGFLQPLVEHAGMVATAIGNVHRFDSSGAPLPVAELTATSLAYDSEGALWVQSRNPDYFANPEIHLSRFPAGSVAAAFSLPLRIAAWHMPVAVLETDAQGNTLAGGGLYAATPLATTSRLVVQQIAVDGAAQTLLDRPWAYPQVRIVQRAGTGWVVLSDQHLRYSANQVVSALDSAGTILWERTMPPDASARLRCSTGDLCALATTVNDVINLERFNLAGQVLDTVALDSVPVLSGSAGQLRGTFSLPGSKSVGVYDLTVFPAQPLARWPTSASGHDSPLGSRLLRLEPDSLAAYGLNTPLWAVPHAGDIQMLSTRQDRLHIVRRDTTTQALSISQLDPDSGAALATTALPQDIVDVVDRTGIDGYSEAGLRLAQIDAASNDQRWLLVRSAAARVELLGLGPQQSVLRFQPDANVRDLRAVPGAAITLGVPEGSRDAIEISRFEFELFGNGFESQ